MPVSSDVGTTYDIVRKVTLVLGKCWKFGADGPYDALPICIIGTAVFPLFNLRHPPGFQVDNVPKENLVYIDRYIEEKSNHYISIADASNV